MFVSFVDFLNFFFYWKGFEGGKVCVIGMFRWGIICIMVCEREGLIFVDLGFERDVMVYYFWVF